MGYYFNTSEDLETGTETLRHFGILGQKHGQRNGPPYPLGSGDHSSSEKSAAKAAGVSVGSDSGKGSIDNVKKKRSKTAKKKPLTPEEKRQLALDAAKSGDKKKIAKNMDQLSTDELRDAQARAQLKDALTKKDPSEQKMSRAEVEKREAMLSGDKEKVKQYASQMTYQELNDAMNKVNLMAKLNYVEPPPTAMDKLNKFTNSLDNFRQAAEKGINAYNLAAQVYNSTNKSGGKWPIIGAKEQPKEKSKEEKMMEALAREFGNGVKASVSANSNRANARIKELQDQVNNLKNKGNKPEERQNSNQQPKPSTPVQQPQATVPKPSTQPVAKPAPSNNDHEYVKKIGKGEDAKYIYEEKEPTAQQKALLESERKKDNAYLNQMRNLSSKKMTDYSDVSYDDLFSDANKESMRTSYRVATSLAEQDDFYNGIYDWMNQY